MRVLFVNSVCGVGSTGRIVTDLVQHLEECGHQAFVAYGHANAQRIDPNKTYKIIGSFGYYWNNAISKLLGFTGAGCIISTRRLIHYIKKTKPDIIHLHNLHGYYVNVYKLFKFLSKMDTPVIWTLHDCWGFTGNCSHYSYVGCDKWTKSCKGCPNIHVYPYSMLFQFTHTMFRLKRKNILKNQRLILTTPSFWLKNQLESSFLAKYSCHVVHNGVDTNLFAIKKTDFKKRMNIENKRMILGVANAWNDKKGFNDFIRLSDLLPSEYVIVLVGLDQNQLTSLHAKIIGIKRTQNLDELVDIYNAADVFFNPSYEETFGMVTIEALLCGTPVVVYNKTAVPEVVQDPYSKVVEAGDEWLL